VWKLEQIVRGLRDLVEKGGDLSALAILDELRGRVQDQRRAMASTLGV
jgi:hypothetical protein